MLRDLIAAGPVAIDGGLASELEARGHDLSGELWSARILRDAPEEIIAVHRAYLEAGARVVTSASYQASRVGLGDDADALLSLSVALAREAVADTDALVAASVGPYGAVLGDGSEYRGNYEISRTQLAAFHAQRLDVLLDAAPDLLAIETIPDLVEAQVLAELLIERGRPSAWISFSANSDTTVCAGQSFAEAAMVAAEVATAVGVNCTAPEYVSALISNVPVEIPVVVYPNAGQVWDGAAEMWRGEPTFNLELVDQWATRANLIGGCCGIGPDGIGAMARRLQPST